MIILINEDCRTLDLKIPGFNVVYYNFALLKDYENIENVIFMICKATIDNDIIENIINDDKYINVKIIGIKDSPEELEYDFLFDCLVYENPNDKIIDYIYNNPLESPQEASKDVLKEDYLYLIGGTYRLGISKYIYTLEKELGYRNVDIFLMKHATYNYMICGISLDHKNTAFELCNQFNLKLIPGRPVCSINGPLNLNYNDNFVYTLTNIDSIEISNEELALKLKNEWEEILKSY